MIVLPAAERSSMQNGGPLITTSCMMMAKLYTSPCKVPWSPACPLLRISGAVHSNSKHTKYIQLDYFVSVVASSLGQTGCDPDLLSHRLQVVQCKETSETPEPHCSHNLWPSGQIGHPPHNYGTSDDCGKLRGGGGTSYPDKEKEQVG